MVSWGTLSGLLAIAKIINILLIVVASVATQPAPDPRNPEGEKQEPCGVGPVTPEELLVAIHLLEFAKDPNAPADEQSSSKFPIKIYI